MLPTLTVLGWSFSTYWMMFVIGVVGMAVLCCVRAKMYRLSYPKAIIFSLLLAIFGLLGTKLLYILENWKETLEDGVTFGGQSFFGALFLLPFAVSLYGLILGLRPAESMDMCASPVIFILMCMRMGCMLNGCCGGISIGGFQVPTQLLEALADAAILTVLLVREKEKKHQGFLYPTLMVTYSSFRFVIEFVRDTEKDWLGLSHGQWFSLIALAVGSIWLSKRRHK